MSSLPRWALAASLCCAVAAFAQEAAPRRGSGNERFDAATALEAQGKFADAARALEALATEEPDDPYADDALAEAALIEEQQLAHASEAIRLLDRLIERYPQSRLRRRAELHRERLRAAIATGEGPLAEYQKVTISVGKTPAAQAAALRTFLVKYPDFSLRDEARMQLAAAEGRAHELDAALATYALVEASASTPEARHYALVLRAELLVDMGRLDEAAPLVRQLAADHPVVKKLANARARRRVTVVAIIELVLTVLAFSWLLGRAGWRALGCRLPTESLYFLPMALLFVVAGLTEHAAIRTALVLLALGGLVLVTLFSALVRERTNANSARFGFAGRFAVVAAFILAVLSLFFLVIEYCDLIGLMVETFRHGPER